MQRIQITDSKTTQRRTDTGRCQLATTIIHIKKSSWTGITGKVRICYHVQRGDGILATECCAWVSVVEVLDGTVVAGIALQVDYVAYLGVDVFGEEAQDFVQVVRG